MALKVELDGRSLPSKFGMQYLTKGQVGRYVSVGFANASEPDTSFACSCVCQNLSENQCIFIRGFRVARTLGILPKHLRAAAEPSTDMAGNDRDSGREVELISMPTVSEVSYLVYAFDPLFDPPKHQDPLHFIFEYVAGVSNEGLNHAFILGNFDFTAIP